MTAAPVIRALETRYKGYRFRSRLEARWAVFFDAMGLEWQYEPQGFALGGIPYLPDFYLPSLDVFVEIKGQMPSGEEYKKALMLSSLRTTYIFKGDPMGAFAWCFGSGRAPLGPTDCTFEWCKSSIPSQNGITSFYDDARMDWDAPNLVLRGGAEICGLKARAVRFEHGERP